MTTHIPPFTRDAGEPSGVIARVEARAAAYPPLTFRDPLFRQWQTYGPASFAEIVDALEAQARALRDATPDDTALANRLEVVAGMLRRNRAL
jgi:hypothetical protein